MRIKYTKIENMNHTIFVEKFQNALEHHHVVARIYKIYFWNQYDHSFQMSYHEDFAYVFDLSKIALAALKFQLCKARYG